MSGNTADVIAYRVERARQSLAQARLMAEGRHPNACVNRLYYACFYAVSALLLKHGFSSAKHSGVRSLFGLHLVKTGIVPKDLGAFYNDLFDCRQESDYQDFFEVDQSELSDMIEQANRLVGFIADLVDQPA